MQLTASKDISGYPPELTQWRYDPATYEIVNDASNYVIDALGSPSTAMEIAGVPKDGFKSHAKWVWDADKHSIINAYTGHIICSGAVSSSNPNRMILWAKKAPIGSPECRWKTDIFN